MDIKDKLILALLQQNVRLEEERKLAEARALVAEREAQVCPMTGLWNKKMFHILSQKKLEEARRQLESKARRNTPITKKFVVIFFDLNFFKVINDTFGHKTGDSILEIFAAKLTQRYRKEDIIARLGGDEFAVTMLVDIAYDVSKNLAWFCDWAEGCCRTVIGDVVKFGVSAGTAVFTGVETIEQLVSEADASMYKDKAAKHATR